MYFISLFSLSKLFSMYKIVRFSPFSVFNQRKNDGEDTSVRIASFYSVSYKEPNTLRASVVYTYIHTHAGDSRSHSECTPYLLPFSSFIASPLFISCIVADVSSGVSGTDKTRNTQDRFTIARSPGVIQMVPLSVTRVSNDWRLVAWIVQKSRNNKVEE